MPPPLQVCGLDVAQGLRDRPGLTHARQEDRTMTTAQLIKAVWQSNIPQAYAVEIERRLRETENAPTATKP